MRRLVLAAIVAALASPAAAQPIASERVSLSGALAGWHVFRLDPDSPRERPSTTLDLYADANRPGLGRFFTHLRAGYDGKVGDPDERNRPLIGFNEYYQDKDLFTDVDEAYADVVYGNAELRIGKQKISWGQLDEIQPTDNLNPEDLSEFYFRP